MLVNNAGLGRYMPFLELPPEGASELVEVMAHAPVRLSRAALPGMVERGSGAVVNLASMLAFSRSVRGPLPKRAVYAATRSFIVTFSQLLAGELEGTGVQVQALCPSVVRTEFHERQGLDLSDRPRMRPEDVVGASLKGLELGEVVCCPGVEDASALGRLDELEAEVYGGAMRSETAERYRD
jgi:short-subunit dehydrogenase